MASTRAPLTPSPARWRPCEKNCPATLQWPVRHAPGWFPIQGLPDLGPEPELDFDSASLPDLPLPAHSLLALCGEAGLRRLVHRHMTRLRLTPLLSGVQECFDCVCERYGDFVIESCGGPHYYSEQHPRLRAGSGLPLLLDEVGREIWLVQLWHSFDDVGLSDRLRNDFWNWAEPLSLHLLAPRARPQGIVRRYPLERVRSWFTPPVPTNA